MKTTKKNKPAISLRERALAYLTRREYSYQELQQKLRMYASEEDDVQALLDDFKQRGWLSDARYTEQIVHARKGRFGSLRVAHELREHGVADELIGQAVAEVQTDELATATNVYRKKFATPPQSREEWAKQARFLQGRGFGFEIIRQVLRNTPDED
ncbi:recombination regulator RecX [Methylobacillus gramineus]|uniref:recombination regulator RecX n=1 Tax=Methylobacillus gramineus TaxID=755169 RepID=UPI001D000378|nr:recombination regulator RecX [Methylobacillus gramineus]MCB5185126.1 recombination regulator RecX [Methylobacillus gramineus]